MTFKDLEIIEPILKALEAKGYTNPTPIQEQSIPILLGGNDLLGCAQTGTGKTAAFAIPIIQSMYLDRSGHDDGRDGRDHRNGRDSRDDRDGRDGRKMRVTRNVRDNRKVRALVVTPTRELAIQIGESFTDYGKFTSLRHTTIFGGVKQHGQTQALRQGVDTLVATPGRLLDLINQGYISLKDIEYFVLDEADQMLDMGFLPDIKRIIAQLPTERQSLFFSATLPPDIVRLSQKILGDPQKVTIQPEQTTAERVEQAIYFVEKKSKVSLLVHLLGTDEVDSALVFSRTKHGADKIVRKLNSAGIRSSAIHGNKSQVQRQRALGAFKDGNLHVLVATDIAARGIDVSELSHVINYDLPNVPETYVHRIGRTGRAGASGIAISFCDMDEKPYLKDIQKLIQQEIPVEGDHPWHDIHIATAPFGKAKGKSKSGGGGGGSRGGGGGGGGYRGGGRSGGGGRGGSSRGGGSSRSGSSRSGGSRYSSGSSRSESSSGGGGSRGPSSRGRG